ncbi:MAG: RHS repeat-associated core domain-containing protein [Armatimonadetes bacterium]|nr:RHS repeat-associated core domain-containing protein [Armatimonadota bacterium]
MTISWVPPGEEEVSGHYDENLAENLPTSRYYYDGQMMVEDDYTVEGQYEPVVTVMRYGIGARGIDFMDKRVDDGPETKGYPIYDGHGNMIATLGQTQGSPYYSLADLRSYDVWGSVRSGSTTGDPKQRYCANLGHVQDDESGLIYMRARYYEPWTGRFVSEDPAREGGNWFVYAICDSVNNVDPDGMATMKILLEWVGSLLFGAMAVASLTGAHKQLIALLGAFTGLVNTITFVMRMCVAASAMTDLSGGGGKGAVAAMGAFALWKALSSLAMLWFGSNLAWFIELYSDPNDELGLIQIGQE